MCNVRVLWVAASTKCSLLLFNELRHQSRSLKLLGGLLLLIKLSSCNLFCVTLSLYLHLFWSHALRLLHYRLRWINWIRLSAAFKLLPQHPQGLMPLFQQTLLQPHHPDQRQCHQRSRTLVPQVLQRMLQVQALRMMLLQLLAFILNQFESISKAYTSKDLDHAVSYLASYAYDLPCDQHACR